MEIKWIKIVTDIFDDEKILLIEAMPESDSIIVIWFKLLCMAGKQNNNGVFTLNDKIAYTDEMLATIFRRPLNTVRLALNTFEKYGMIEIVNNVITIPNWDKHQSLDKLQAAKEKNRIRVATYRAKQKRLSKCNDYSNVTVMESNAIDKDIDKEKDNNIVEQSSTLSAIKEIVDYLNLKAGTSYRHTTKDTQKHIKARLDEGYSVDDFKKVIDNRVSKWKGTDMQDYLRPSTLFTPKNFENYLNSKEQVTNQSNQNSIKADNNDLYYGYRKL